MDKRMITTDAIEEDLPLEGNLRPQTLDEYIGQEHLVGPDGVFRHLKFI